MIPFESLQIDGFATGTQNDVKGEVSRFMVFRLKNHCVYLSISILVFE